MRMACSTSSRVQSLPPCLQQAGRHSSLGNDSPLSYERRFAEVSALVDKTDEEKEEEVVRAGLSSYGVRGAQPCPIELNRPGFSGGWIT